MKNFWTLVSFGVFLALAAGWVMNLIHCISYAGGGNADDGTAEVVVRIIGIFAAPLGGIAGWL